jgi:hypothetical protein
MKLRTIMSALCATVLAVGCTPASAPDDSRQLLPPRGGAVSGGPARMVRLGPFSGLNDDCSTQSYAGVRILQRPRHGELRVARGQGVATFSANNAFARCNGAPIRGTYAIYTANPGYQGPDSFRIEVVFADGERRVLAPVVNVPPE